MKGTEKKETMVVNCKLNFAKQQCICEGGFIYPCRECVKGFHDLLKIQASSLFMLANGMRQRKILVILEFDVMCPVTSGMTIVNMLRTCGVISCAC